MINATITIENEDLLKESRHSGSKRRNGEQFSLDDEQRKKLDTAISTLRAHEGVDASRSAILRLIVGGWADSVLSQYEVKIAKRA